MNTTVGKKKLTNTSRKKDRILADNNDGKPSSSTSPETEELPNTLAARHPELAAQWHPTLNGELTPEGVTPGSRTVFWWQCPTHTDHVWDSKIANRLLVTSFTCAYCSGRRILKGFNDLSIRFPETSVFWDHGKNTVSLYAVKPSSNLSVYWKCGAGHSWEQNVDSQVKLKGRCPFCSDLRVWAGFNDLATIYPEATKTWHPMLNGDNTPSLFRAHAKNWAWWKCELGHDWKARIVNRVKVKSPCPVCANRVLLKGYNDLASRYPGLLEEWDYDKNKVMPDEVMWGAGADYHWKCKEGHEWEDSPSHRNRNNRGCPYCSGQRTLPGYNDLATHYPDIAAQWHPEKNGTLTPEDVTQGSHRDAWWQCTVRNTHEWKAEIGGRRQYGCPFCSGRYIESDFNDLLTRYPKIAATWHPTLNGDTTPDTVAPFSPAQAWWLCTNKHEYSAPLARRILNGCAQCAAQRFSSKAEGEISDLLTTLKIPHKKNIRSKLAGRKLELDIYIPEHKFAIEFNGVYWHSEKGGKDKNYHSQKLEACNKEGITLYQVWEDDWNNKREVVIRGILHRLGMTTLLSSILPDAPLHWYSKTAARKLKVVALRYDTSSVFLEQHHIQGKASGTHYLGLEDKEGLLRAVMVLKKTSAEKNVLSIERYATAGIIAGGFTKLLSYAEREYVPEQWVTFADRSLSEGGLYESNGFVVDRIIPPDYSYFWKAQREHKFNYRKSRFRTDPKLLYEEGLTERQLAELNDLNRIWDSGKVRYVKHVTPK